MALTAGITYAVQYQADGQGPWIVLASRVVETSYTARSLCPGSHYRFRILLVTPQGCSSPSPTSAPCLLPGDRDAIMEDLSHKDRRITDEYIIKEEIG
uniref:immunoglobulin-like and fibronectin type III domain-containing protein 1 n=1 Tax=Myxine glutinosa TaxID=7769 RepID=UPI00358F2406